MFIDVHAHLDFASLDKFRSEILSGIVAKGILVLSNTLSYENYLKTLEIFGKAKNVFVCPGLYPQDAEKVSEVEFVKYLDFLRKNRSEFKAIGEVGLDFYHTLDLGLRAVQVERFKRIVELSIELDKPLIVHTRKAEAEVLEIISEFRVKFPKFNKYVLHCFSGSSVFFEKIKSLKVYVSIPMIVLNTKGFQDLVREVAIGQILIETDSPFLKAGGGINTPLSVPLIYEQVAKIKGFDAHEIENIIYRNYQRLFV